MRTITVIAVATILLLELSDALPKSSVGGPMAMLMIFFLALLALGLYEAWSQRRGLLGWIVSIVASVVGGFLGTVMASMFLGTILSYLNLGGPLAASQHPMRYIGSAGMMLLALLGSWIALQIVSRYR
jgi:hypothetical protein